MNDPSPDPQPREPAVSAANDAPAQPPVLGYHVPRSGRAVTVAFCADGVEAELLCAELNAAGVMAASVNEHAAATLTGYGLVRVEVQVAVEDRERAAEVLARLPASNELEPEPEPADGSADFATDEEGRRVALAVVAEFPTAREMQEAAAALGSARVRSYLPNLVPRPRGAEGPRPVFRVRVAEEDVARATDVLGEAGDADEPRCPQCASWRVHAEGGSFFSWLAGLFRGEPADGVRRMQCLVCRHHFAWGNPKGTFEVVPVENGGASTQ